MESDEYVEDMLCAAERTERRTELQAYLDRHQVTPLLNELVAELLVHMPDNVPDFVVRYFESRFPDRVPRRRAYDGGGAEYPAVGQPATASPPSVPESDDSSSGTSSSSEDDYVDELPPPPVSTRSRARRGVVFSEVMPAVRCCPALGLNGSPRPPNHTPHYPSYARDTGRMARQRCLPTRRARRSSPASSPTSGKQSPPRPSTLPRGWATADAALLRLLSHMDGEQMDTFAQAMFPVSFSSGDSIIRQGDAGDNLYIVSSGQCSVWLKKGEGEEAIRVRRAGPPSRMWDDWLRVA